MHAGRMRLRPILMTTFALIAGMMPVAIGVGEGGEFYRPMAVTIIGGTITSTLLTLLVVPTLLRLDRDRARPRLRQVPPAGGALEPVRGLRRHAARGGAHAAAGAARLAYRAQAARAAGAGPHRRHFGAVGCGALRRLAPRLAARLRKRRRWPADRRYPASLTCIKGAPPSATRIIETEGFDVPGSHPWARRPGCGECRRDAVGRRLRRGPLRAGLPELRLGAHGRARDGVLPHRRARDPLARAGDGAGCADHPGPDAAAPGGPLRRARRSRVTSSSTRRAASRSWASANSCAAFAPDRRCTRGRDRDRDEARGTPAAQRGAAGRVRRDHAASSPSTSVERAIREKFPGKVGAANALAAREAFDIVSRSLQGEAAHA